MSKNKKQDLEKIFQEAAESYPADFEEKDWQAMKSMLDQERDRLAGIRKNNIYRTVMFIALLLFITGSVYMLSSNDKKEIQGVEKKSFVPTNQVSEHLEEKQPISKGDISGSITENTVEEGTKKGAKETLEDTKLKEAPPNRSSNSSNLTAANKGAVGDSDNENPVLKQSAIKDEPENNVHTNQSADDLYKFEYVKSKAAPDIAQKSVESKPHVEKNTSVVKKAEGSELGSELEKAIANEEFQDNQAIATNNDKKKKGGEIALTENLGKEASIDSLTKTTKSEPVIEKDDQPSQPSPLSITLVVGPDISSIGLKNLTRPGYSYGMMIHYNISRKFSIGIGALKGNKNYLGKGSDYNISADYWKYATNNVVPDEVAGQCAILEIPIELKWNFFTTQKTNLNFSAGTSSYFMLHESYEYSFDEPNPYASGSWNSENADGKHLFNIINFSIGYERSLGKKFHIGIAPYIKVPVEGIGWSKVKFMSMGTYFTLRYDLLNR